MAARRGLRYNHIVIEHSGVAEPKAVRENFLQLAAMGHPLLQAIELRRRFPGAYGDSPVPLVLHDM